MKMKKKSEANNSGNGEMDSKDNEDENLSNDIDNDNDINDDSENDVNDDNENYNGEEPYDWEKLSDHQMEELFPPSVMNSRRICRSGLGSFYSSSTSININTNSSNNNANPNSGGNSERLGFEFDNLHQKGYTQNQPNIERFHLLADHDDINSKKKCLQCCGCFTKFKCSIC